jgi:RHS repeat-associated protein
MNVCRKTKNMSMPGRSYNNGNDYRYGFNTQEKTPEISSNSYTAEYWQYDARIGRRFNIDPRPNVSISVYAAFSNNPIIFSDPLGDSIGPVSNSSSAVPLYFDLKKISSSFLGVVNATLPPIFWNEQLYPAIQGIDKKYARSPISYMRGHTVTYPVPEGGYRTFLFFHRGAGGAKSKDNRDEAYKSFPETNVLTGPIDGKMLQKHEVPYASTQEGGFGALVEYASAEQNRKHGTALNKFFADLGIKEGDAFLVPIFGANEEPERSPEAETKKAKAIDASPILIPIIMKASEQIFKGLRNIGPFVPSPVRILDLIPFDPIIFDGDGMGGSSPSKMKL